MLVEEDVLCYHCGQPCDETLILEEDKCFVVETATNYNQDSLILILLG